MAHDRKPPTAQALHETARAEDPQVVDEVAPGVREGDVLAGKYRVSRVLGVGGMGVVVEARHLQLEERVAIKLLLPAALADADIVARFNQEARASVRIKNEHVVRVIDVGNLDSGAPYMVMEYLDGLDLGTWLVRRGPMPIEQAIDFILQACAALAEAHALGIVHRDLKPSNLFCIRCSDARLRIKVLDFGVSKVLSQSGGDPRMTKTKTVMGSPLYMSPEQMQSARSVDLRADIWSLGAVMFELVTGNSPFPGETFPEVCAKVLTAPAPLLREHLPGAPAQLEVVIARCLEKDRTRRYGSVAELAQDLASLSPQNLQASVERICAIVRAAGSPSAPSVDGFGTTMAAPAVVDTLSPPLGRTTPTQPRKRSKLVTVAAVAGLVTVAGGSAGYFTVYRKVPDPERSAHTAPPANAMIPASTAMVREVIPTPVDAMPPPAPQPSAPAEAVPPPAPPQPEITKPAGAASKPGKPRKKSNSAPTQDTAQMPKASSSPAPETPPTETPPRATRRWTQQH